MTVWCSLYITDIVLGFLDEARDQGRLRLYLHEAEGAEVMRHKASPIQGSLFSPVKTKFSKVISLG